MKTVLTYGTFDLFHVGHVRLLKRLSALGDELIVGLSTDAFNKGKGKHTVIPFDHRKEILLSNQYVDKVIAEESWEQKIDDVKNHNVDIFAMGDDWAGKFDFLKEHCEVYYLPRTENISTTEIKQYVRLMEEEKLAQLRSMVEGLSEFTRKL